MAKEIRPELPVQYVQQIPTIQALLLHLEGKGRSPNTIAVYQSALKALSIRADLTDTKAVELAIARYKQADGRNITNNYKSKLCDCYATYCKFNKTLWDKPVYTPEPTTIQPPTEEKVKILVASAKGRLSILIDISQQTGLRPIEIFGEKGLMVKDIHPDSNTITARITKKCNARPPLPITPELTARIQGYIQKHNLNNNDQLFKGKGYKYGELYRRFRNNLANKLHDPTIKTIDSTTSDTTTAPNNSNEHKTQKAYEY